MIALKKKAIVASIAALAAGCATMRDMMPSSARTMATASLSPTTGNTARGTVAFTQDGHEVRVRASVSGLKPNAEHGFHVHEKGDCSSGDGMSTGGHFNPAGKPHGSPATAHHAGDMPSLKADASGNASASFELKGVSIGTGAADLVGKGVIVHRDPDDYATQPTGNAGPRIACGVIAKS
ncbi:MAG: superoxide dismutase family protein [Usitatibacter sp.]